MRTTGILFFLALVAAQVGCSHKTGGGGDVPAQAGTEPRPRRYVDEIGSSLERSLLSDGTLRLAIVGHTEYRLEMRVPWALDESEVKNYRVIVPKRSASLFKSQKLRVAPAWVELGKNHFYGTITHDTSGEKWLGYVVFHDNCAITGIWLPKAKGEEAKRWRQSLLGFLSALPKHTKSSAPRPPGS